MKIARYATITSMRMEALKKYLNRKELLSFLKQRYYHVGALLIIVIWLTPLILSRGRIEWGDFSYFSQLYEAITLSIVNYHQFPWWNPWMAGGVPLYANPQAGVFSITTILALFLSAPVALKLTVALFYLLGYATFVGLIRHLGVRGPIAALLGLVWVLNGFFAAHLPGHFTFIWFMLTPGFIHLALILRGRQTGIMLGAAMGVMALAQLHYSFVQISIIVALIIAVRLVVDAKNRRSLFTAGLWALGVFTVLAGHRIYFTLQNVRSYSREVVDPASTLAQSIQSFFVPYSYNFGVRPASTPYYGWLEQTAYPSVFLIAAVIISVLFLIYLHRSGKVNIGAKMRRIVHTKAGLIALGTTLAFIIGLGGNTWAAPYQALKFIPLFSQMRISARWFIYAVLGLLLFVGVVYAHRLAKGYHRWLVVGFVSLAVLELIVLNFGYQAKVLKHVVSTPPAATSSLTFQQHIRFGESKTTPDGVPIAGANKQYIYREYESTLYNIGTILANEVFVNLYDNKTPRCSYVAMCGLVLSKNADVAYWSPNKIILERTGEGPIELNMNKSSYLRINGQRQSGLDVTERFARFTIDAPDSEKRIIVTFSGAL